MSLVARPQIRPINCINRTVSEKRVGFAESKMEKRTVINMERIVIQLLKLLFLKLFSRDPNREPTIRFKVGSEVLQPHMLHRSLIDNWCSFTAHIRDWN